MSPLKFIAGFGALQSWRKATTIPRASFKRSGYQLWRAAIPAMIIKVVLQIVLVNCDRGGSLFKHGSIKLKCLEVRSRMNYYFSIIETYFTWWALTTFLTFCLGCGRLLEKLGFSTCSWCQCFLSLSDGGPSGPGQTGRGCNGQYVYWIVMVQPTP